MNNRGFTIFFASLVSSLALAIGLAIFDLTIRELDLSATANQSQYAIYASDTGAECALYWDAKCELAGCVGYSAFPTSSASSVPSSGVMCNNIDVAAAPWTFAETANAATTTFVVTFSPQPYCVKVEVGKYVDGSGTVFTNMVSRGYNTTCPPAVAPVTRLERTLQVTY